MFGKFDKVDKLDTSLAKYLVEFNDFAEPHRLHGSIKYIWGYCYYMKRFTNRLGMNLTSFYRKVEIHTVYQNIIYIFYFLFFSQRNVYEYASTLGFTSCPWYQTVCSHNCSYISN